MSITTELSKAKDVQNRKGRKYFTKLSIMTNICQNNCEDIYDL